ncbi:MAG TPA: sigma-70 family RNA polymerase sigma factor, partial [Trebonia sp.]|nr:sigma-70 family RNA polymerase sigma factor [Trebonia sp.]
RPYAMPCITGEIKKHFRDHRWQVRVTRPVQELLLVMRPATEELVRELGRHPTDAELAGHLEVGEDDLREARQAGDAAFSALSLDAPVGGGGQEDPGELGALLGEDDPDVDRSLDMQAVERHWGELPEREQHILTLRFYGNMTQEEIARRLGISQMHVSRLLARALARLRSRLLDDEEVGPGAAQPVA